MRLNRNLSSWIVLVAGCLIAGILFLAYGKTLPHVKETAAEKPAVQDKEALPADTAHVAKTIDGDTIDVEVKGKIQRVRLMGVDTPETKDPRKPVQCFGKEASVFTKHMLENTAVRLEIDPSQDATDMYGRWLRYVILTDGTNFNEQLIARGYAHEYTFKSAYKYQAEFKAAEQTAHIERRGLWATDACGGNNN